jgi:hypothetical protein
MRQKCKNIKTYMKQKKTSTTVSKKHITQQENEHVAKWIQMPITKKTKKMTIRMMVLFHNTKRGGHNVAKATHKKNKGNAKRF